MTRKLLSLLLAIGTLAACTPAAKSPTPLRRDHSFFGIHFDFHAGPKDENIGARTTPEMVQAIIDMAHPDYIQVDCKGHPGYSSYPTEVGNRVPSLVGDPLKVWREVTARNGVALYMHYSGVLDSRAIELHPGWAEINKDGEPRPNVTSVFGPYADSLLIPQLKELAGVYGVDGVWVDGECWATCTDYCEAAVKAFREKYGAVPPKNPGEPLWYEWKDFNRQAFRDYMKHYADAVHAEYPDFQICSNWAFTHHMPEPVSVPVDFLSGDYSKLNSVNYVRVAARYLQSQGMPWDLMAWSFYGISDGSEQKPAVQLMREAAVTLSQGGGFQIYFTQNRDGSVNLDKLFALPELAAFARARQPFCFRSASVPQVALLFSEWDYRHRDNPKNPAGLYPSLTDRVDGILQCLLECQYSVDIMGEEKLLAYIDKYPLVVVPADAALSPEFREELRRYEDQGGKVLMAAGTDTEAGTDREELRAGMKAAVSELFPDPMVEMEGSPYVDLALRTLNGKLQLHLVNTSGDHRNSPRLDEIPPVDDLRVSVRLPRKPRSIVLQPSGERLDFTYSDGKASFTLERLEIYDIVEIKQ